MLTQSNIIRQTFFKVSHEFKTLALGFAESLIFEIEIAYYIKENQIL